MKKALSIAIAAAVIVIIISIVLTSGSSSKLSGTYVCVDSSQIVSKLDFQGNRVTVTDMGLLVKSDYELKDGRIYINGTASFLGSEMSVDYEYEFQQTGNSIFLDGVEYKKH